MGGKTRATVIVWCRRAVQCAFLMLFLYLFLQATFHSDNQVGRSVTFFFEIDPLVLFTAWLGSSPIPRALLLSLLTLAVTLFLGRWFCGWVCPFGVLHNAIAALRVRRAKIRLTRGGYHPRQRWKYYILISLLVAALLGANLIGWLDPFSFFYRSLATAIYPGINLGLHDAFAWIYDKDPGWGAVRLTVVTEPIYEALRNSVLAIELQPQYRWSFLIGILFMAIVALNLYQARFWCRYVCPLGALLGFAGKNPLLRLQKDRLNCNGCRLCVIDCHGGADPDITDGWKPSECFYCWNCRDACGSQALEFTIAMPNREDPS